MCFELNLDTELEGGEDLNVLICTPAVLFLQFFHTASEDLNGFTLYCNTLSSQSSHPQLNIDSRERLSLPLNSLFYTNLVLTDDCTSQKCKDCVLLPLIKEVPLSEIGSVIGSAANVCV